MIQMLNLPISSWSEKDSITTRSGADRVWIVWISLIMVDKCCFTFKNQLKTATKEALKRNKTNPKPRRIFDIGEKIVNYVTCFYLPCIIFSWSLLDGGRILKTETYSKVFALVLGGLKPSLIAQLKPGNETFYGTFFYPGHRDEFQSTFVSAQTQNGSISKKVEFWQLHAKSLYTKLPHNFYNQDFFCPLSSCGCCAMVTLW